MYRPDAPFPVWSHEEWWADDWDGISFGRDYDFSKPFFSQYHNLLNAVPRYAVMNTKSENCEYSNIVNFSKDCYLVFGCVADERCAYGHIVWESKECLDGLYVFKSELCYECIDVLGSYRVLYSEECEDCVSSIGLYDCRGCTNCIGCVGLRQKSYCIFNKPVEKEEFDKFLSEHPLHKPETLSFILEKRKELEKKLPRRYFSGSHNTEASGDHVYNAKNVKYAFDLKGGENSKFVYTGNDVVDSQDVSFIGRRGELGYQLLTSFGMRMMGCCTCVASNDLYYCSDCYSCEYLFGCAGLRNKKYCILNKQYSKEAYQELLPKIVQHMKTANEWGEFFPIALSPFAYNESIAQEYTPLTKEKALSMGYRWEEDAPTTKGQETMAYDALPKNPVEYSDELLKLILKCRHCQRNFRFIPQEIEFLKTAGLPLPAECFNCRHQRRMNARNPRRLWKRQCQCVGAESTNGACKNTAQHFHGSRACPNEFETSYAPDRPEIVYCEACYQAEIG